MKKIIEEMKKIQTVHRDVNRILEDRTSSIALFGAGHFGKAAFTYLQNRGNNILCFIDNAPEKQNRKKESLPVVGFDDSLVTEADCILITPKLTRIIDSMKNQIHGMKPCMTFDSWFVAEHIERYAYLMENIFTDELSKKTLESILLAMLSGQDSFCWEIMQKDQYFCLPNFINVMNETFIDIGAYVGDTLEKFIWFQGGYFKKIYAFEPGKKQFDAMTERKKRLVNEWALNEKSIELVHAGISGQSGTAAVISENEDFLQALYIDTNSKSIDKPNISIFSIDDYMKNAPVTFIKADIEGLEVEMLRGAADTIKRNKPKLAVCTYHSNTDLFEVIDEIRACVPEYTFALRHHTPTLMETVLYAWV